MKEAEKREREGKAKKDLISQVDAGERSPLS